MVIIGISAATLTNLKQPFVHYIPPWTIKYFISSSFSDILTFEL